MQESLRRIIPRAGHSYSIWLLFVFQVYGWLDRSFFFRYFQQLRIELHEGMFNGGILVVAVPAIVLAGRLGGRGFLRRTKAKVSPFVREAGSVLYLHVQALEVFLIAPMLVDGTA